MIEGHSHDRMEKITSYGSSCTLKLITYRYPLVILVIIVFQTKDQQEFTFATSSLPLK
jgi:hypothetical protein